VKTSDERVDGFASDNGEFVDDILRCRSDESAKLEKLPHEQDAITPNPGVAYVVLSTRVARRAWAGEIMAK
jgi:hypothetical protein